MEVKCSAVKLLCDFGVSIYLAAATKYLRPGSLSSKQLFLAVPGGGGLQVCDWGTSRVRFLVNTFFLVCRWPPALCPHMAEKEIVYKDTNPIHEVHPLHSSPPKGSISKYLHPGS